MAKARTAFPIVCAVASLATLCQCSLFFDLSDLDDGGVDPVAQDAADDAATGRVQVLDAETDAATLDAGTLDAATLDAGTLDAATLDTGAADTGAVDARAFDAVAVDAGILDARVLDAVAVDARALDADATTDAAGVGAAVDGGTDAGGIEAAADTGTDAGGVDAPADSSGFAVGLVAFYPFAETSGATSADDSGNNYTATMQGATFAAGLQDNAATMNGSGQYVSLPAGIVSGLTAVSISVWVNLNTALLNTHIFDFGTGTTAYMFLTPQSRSGMLQFTISATGPLGDQVLNAPAPSTGAWQHVCVTLIGTTGTLYVNGVAVAQNTGMTLNPASLGTTTQNWLGRSQFSLDPYLNGKVDDLRIYGRALSAAEVQQIFNQKL
jgi:hypothetical protein